MKKDVKKSSNTFEIYPKCVIPKWIKKGVKCHCLGEANDVLVIDTVGKHAAFLCKSDGETAHGWESFTKMYPLGGSYKDCAREK